MRVVLASDHAGFALKQHLATFVRKLNYITIDAGTDRADVPQDYPDWAETLAATLKAGQADRGILVCGSGVGACIAANKIPGIRAGLCHDTYSAHQGVEHDDMNVLVLGGRVIGTALAEDLVTHFLQAQFTGEDRHVRRLGKVQAIEAKYSHGG
jgi:ribose 5-phosphate isomerase B